MSTNSKLAKSRQDKLISYYIPMAYATTKPFDGKNIVSLGEMLCFFANFPRRSAYEAKLKKKLPGSVLPLKYVRVTGKMVFANNRLAVATAFTRHWSRCTVLPQCS